MNTINVRKNKLLIIQRLRGRLIEFGMKNGLNHPTTIRLSQRLDKLLNDCQSKY